MMKEKKTIFPIIFGLISLCGMIYNLIAYSQLKKLLIPTLLEITPEIDRISMGIMISIFFVAIFHLFLLQFSLNLIANTQKNSFIAAVFFVGVVCSGILILNDAALLSDLGKEYLYWDVTQEWNMLFIVSTLHLGTILVGLILMLTNSVPQKSKLFSQISTGDERVFIITNQVGLICGFLGLLTLFLPEFIIVPERFQPLLYTVLATLAVAPFLSTIFYWLIRNRKKTLTALLDEKQFRDAAIGALLTAILTFLTLSIFLLLRVAVRIDLNNPIYIIGLLFGMIINFSTVLLIRFR
jgi:hypothetical protein